MKKITLLLVAVFLILQSQAQFSQAVKDSVLKLMEYPTAKYSITLGFKAEDYVVPTTDEPDLYKLTKEQLLEKKTGTYTDASLFKALFYKTYYEENKPDEASEYLNVAAERYQQWINAEPSNTKPVDELLLLCMISQNPQMMPGVFNYALPVFPNHLPLLHRAIYYYQFFGKDYNKSQELINKALLLDSLNITTLQYQVTMMGLLQMQDIQQGKPIVYIALPSLQKALNQQPNNIGLQHLDQYHRLFTVYLAGVSRAMKADSEDSYKVFEYFDLTPEEMATVNNAEAWLQQAIIAKGKNHAQLLNNLGVVACIKEKYQQAAAYFSQYYQASNKHSDLEAEIMCHFFMDDYNKMEKLLLEKVEKSKDPLDYGALLKIYDQYAKNKAGKAALINKLEALLSTNPARNQVLAAGYLLQHQYEPLTNLLPLLGDATTEELSIKLTAAVIKGNRTDAVNYLAKWLQLDPSDKKAMAAKAITGL